MSLPWEAGAGPAQAVLRAFLAGRAPACVVEEVWGGGGEKIQLRVGAYLDAVPPPLACVTSVRAVVLQGDRVLVGHDPERAHLLPGGRREPGETIEETLRREVLEESGWEVQPRGLLGFLDYHRLSRSGPKHQYPHPRFAQLVYLAEPVRYLPEGVVLDGYERGAVFRPLAALDHAGFTAYERLFLGAALARRPPAG